MKVDDHPLCVCEMLPGDLSSHEDWGSILLLIGRSERVPIDRNTKPHTGMPAGNGWQETVTMYWLVVNPGGEVLYKESVEWVGAARPLNSRCV